MSIKNRKAGDLEKEISDLELKGNAARKQKAEDDGIEKPKRGPGRPSPKRHFDRSPV